MKKKIIIISLLVVLVGVGTTFYILNKSKKGTQALEYTDIRTNTSPVPETGNPSDYDPYESLYIAAGVVESAQSFSTITTGNVDTVVNQKVNNIRIKNGDESYTQAISTSSMVKVAKEKFHKGNTVVVRDGSIKNDNVTWGNSASTISKDKSFELYGWEPSEFCGYILAPESISSASYKGMTDDGYYKFSYDLNVVIAACNYQRQVKTMAGAKDFPTFDYIKMDVTMDENWNVHQIVSYESYYVTVGVNAHCEATLTETFSINDNKEIPNADFFRGYLDKEIDDNYVPEMDVSSYLADTFGALMDGENHYFNASISMGDFINQGNLVLNISSLTNINAQLQTQDIYLNYSKGRLYFRFKDLKCSVPINISSNIDTSSLSSLSTNSSLLTDALSESTISVEGNHVYILMPISISSYTLNVKFTLTNDNGSYFLNSINATSNIDGINLMINISKSNPCTIYENVSDYTKLDNATWIIDSIKDYIKNKQAQIVIDSKISYNENSIIIKGNATIDDSKVEAYLDLQFNNIILNDLYIAYIDDYIYLSVANLNFKLTIDELKELINKFSANPLEMPKIDLSSTSITSLLNYIPTISSNNNNLIITINEIIIEMIKLENQQGINIKNLKYNDLLVDKLYITASPSTNQVLLDENDYLSYEEISLIFDYIDPAKELISGNPYNYSIDSTITKNNITNKVTGFIFVKNDESLKLEGNINIYDGITIKHKIDFVAINEILYLTYTDFTGQSINVKMSYISIKQTINDVLNILGIEIPYLDNILGEIDESQRIDASLISNLIKSDTSDVVINDYINGLSITSNKIELLLNGKTLFNNEKDLTITVNKTDNAINKMSINNLYMDGSLINCDVDITNTDKTVNEPTGSYDDMSYLPRFINEFITTANLRQYYLSGDVSLSIIDYNALTPKINLYITLDENNNPTIKGSISLEVSLLTSMLLVGSASSTITSNFYYTGDDYLYLDRTYKGSLLSSKTTTEYKKMKLDNIMEIDNIMSVVYFLFGLNSTAQNLIGGQITSTGDSNDDLSIASIYKSCTFTDISNDEYNSKYSLVIDCGVLANSDSLNDINIDIYSNTSDYLCRADINLGIASILTISANINLLDIGQTVSIILPNLNNY